MLGTGKQKKQSKGYCPGGGHSVVIYNSFTKVLLGKGTVFETKEAGEKGPDPVVPQLIVE